MSSYRPCAGVGVLEYDQALYVASLPAGPIMVLEGIAALIWFEACGGDRASIADRVAAATDASPQTIRVEVEAFVASLVQRGLLVAAEAGPGTGEHDEPGAPRAAPL